MQRVFGQRLSSFAEAQEEAGVTRFEEDSFIARADISIDHAVMEKAERIAMVLAGFGWSDVGSDAVAGAHELTRTVMALLVLRNAFYRCSQYTH